MQRDAELHLFLYDVAAIFLITKYTRMRDAQEPCALLLQVSFRVSFDARHFRQGLMLLPSTLLEVS